MNAWYDNKAGQTMISERSTMEQFGHTFDEARCGDRIVVVCGKCGEHRIMCKGAYLRHRKRTGHLDDLCRSCSHTGHIFTAEAKENMSNAKLGKSRNLSADARQRIGDAARKTHTGKSATAETRAKMSASQKGRPLNTRPRGSKHCSWKGGVSQWRNALTSSTTYKNWRTAVFERDNYTCQMCNERGGRLEAHHIRMVSANKNTLLIFDVNNGITLCKKCHSSIRNNEQAFEKHFDNMIENMVHQKT